MRVRLTPRRRCRRARARLLRRSPPTSTTSRSRRPRIEDKERQLRQVIDSIPTPMCYVDAGDALPLRERRVPRLHRHARRSEIIGRSRCARCWARSAGRCCSRTSSACGAGESLAVERLVRFADGRARWMTVRLVAALRRAASTTGYYATTSDIHEQKMRRGGAAPRQHDPLRALRQHAARGDRVGHGAAHRALVGAGGGDLRLAGVRGARAARSPAGASCTRRTQHARRRA